LKLNIANDIKWSSKKNQSRFKLYIKGKRYNESESESFTSKKRWIRKEAEKEAEKIKLREELKRSNRTKIKKYLNYDNCWTFLGGWIKSSKKYNWSQPEENQKSFFKWICEKPQLTSRMAGNNENRHNQKITYPKAKILKKFHNLRKEQAKRCTKSQRQASNRPRH